MRLEVGKLTKVKNNIIVTAASDGFREKEAYFTSTRHRDKILKITKEHSDEFQIPVRLVRLPYNSIRSLQ